jgi:hypothetical protein
MTAAGAMPPQISSLEQVPRTAAYGNATLPPISTTTVKGNASSVNGTPRLAKYPRAIFHLSNFLVPATRKSDTMRGSIVAAAHYPIAM